MPNVSKTIGPLVGGVSQAPAHMRPAEYADDILNALIDASVGTSKRPGTRHIAKLDSSSDGHYSGASLFPFTAGDKARYILSVADGELRVVEADTGTARSIAMTPGAVDYITGPLDSTRAFAAAANGDTLYLVNRNRVVKMQTTASASRAPEALIAVRSSDYGTTYTVVLNGVRATYTTPAATDASVRALLDTDAIAEQLALAINAAAGGSAFTITRLGSAIHIKRSDDAAFTLSTFDGLADKGLSVLFGSVTSALDLPPNGVVDGFTIRVVGDAKNSGDDYWLRWDTGVWRECAAPGSTDGLDPSTMPHALVLGGAIHDGIVVPPALPAPTAQVGGGSTLVAWDSVDPLGLSTAGDDEAVSAALPVDGADAVASVTFSLDASSVYANKKAVVTLMRLSGVTETTLETREYLAGGVYSNQHLTGGVTAFATGDKVVLRVDLADTTEPDLGYESIATLIAGRAEYTPINASLVLLNPTAMFPESAVLSITSNTDTRTYTIPSGGQTGAAIATAFAAAWTGAVNSCVDLGGGRLVFQNTGFATPPTVSASLAFDPATQLWVVGGGLTPGALAGLRVTDLTTGASGVVTANTSAIVTFSALSGGTATTLRPGDLVRIQAAEDTFAFSPVEWETRTAGDSNSNKAPSFVGRTISDVGITQSRLVLDSSEYVVASGAGALTRFFRTTVQQVIDSDPIDVRGTASRGLPFWHMVEWRESLHLINARSIFRLAGEPLAPGRVGLPHVFEVSADERCRPIVAGRRLYIARAQGGFTQLLGLESVGADGSVDSLDITQDVPKYLLGSPIALAADAKGEKGPIVVVTELAGTRYVYAVRSVSVGGGTVFAWNQWTFPPGSTPLAMTMDGANLVLVVERGDGVYLESLDTLANIS